MKKQIFPIRITTILKSRVSMGTVRNLLKLRKYWVTIKSLSLRSLWFFVGRVHVSQYGRMSLLI